ncbi:MAG: HEAT repeat domain-containing protein [Vicinamibacteria bacterium]
MTSPTSTPLRNFALALASTLVFAGLIEGTARVFEPPPVQRQEYLWDWTERFKDSEFYTLEKGEGYPPSEENNVDGLRDASRPVETTDGLRRVVILGDSVVFGHGLESSEAFPALMERKSREMGYFADVFNVALPGWSTHQERLAYERIARKYKPSIVILAVCLNDFAELQINLSKPPPGALLTLFKHSATVRMAMGASRREIGAVEDLFTDADSKRVANAFRLFFDEVRAIRDEVTKDGASFRLVIFPFRFQTEAGAPPPSVQARVAEFAKSEGIPFFDFLPDLMKKPAPTSLFLDYDHFNQAGHRVIADWLYLDAITKTGHIDDPPMAWTSGFESSPGLLARLEQPAAGEQRERPLWLAREHASQLSSTSSVNEPLRRAVIAMAVDDKDPRIRFEAARTAFYLGLPDESEVPALIRGVQHADPRVRAFATWTLGEMGPIAKDAIPALVALAKQDGGAGKTGALTAIGKIGGDSPETIPLLLQELKHPKENRRYRAARTIGKMGPAAAAAVPGLTEALNDSSPLVRLHVVRAFGNLGEAAKPAIPALIQVLNNDPDPEVRKEVAATLSKLPGR